MVQNLLEKKEKGKKVWVKKICLLVITKRKTFQIRFNGDTNKSGRISYGDNGAINIYMLLLLQYAEDQQ